MKRKSMATLIGGLLSVCLIGVGFASWIIVQDGQDSLQGTVHVETVSDNSVYIEASWVSGVEKEQFNFTAPTAATTNTTNWLVSTTTNAEKLEIDVKVKIINATKVDGDVKVTWDTSSLTAYEKYIKPVATSDISIPTADDNTNGTWGEEHGVRTYTTTITLAFTWGEYFGGNNNPYAFYNAKGARELVKDTDGFASAHATVDGHDADSWTWADEAEYVLTQLYGANDAVTTLTLFAKAKRTDN